jgi:hypothetical protein
MPDLSAFDMAFRPVSYWPEGFEPVVLEANPPEPHLVEPGWEIYMSRDLTWHWVPHPDEVVIVSLTTPDRQRICARRDTRGRIRYRFVTDHPELQMPPGVFQLPFRSSAEPLTFGELVYLLDMTEVAEEPEGESMPGLAAFHWYVDDVAPGTRTDRLLAVTQVHFRSPFYPQLEAYYHAVGREYVQTGELHEVQERP